MRNTVTEIQCEDGEILIIPDYIKKQVLLTTRDIEIKVYTVTDYEQCKVLGVFQTIEEAESLKFSQKIPVHCHIEEVEFKKECRCKK